MNRYIVRYFVQYPCYSVYDTERKYRICNCTNYADAKNICTAVNFMNDWDIMQTDPGVANNLDADVIDIDTSPDLFNKP